MPSIMNHAAFLLAALAAAPALVSAHGHVVSINVKGQAVAGFEPGNPNAASVGWKTTVQDNGFVAGSAVNSPDIICHRGATNAGKTAKVAAGDSISIKWDTWPASHVGPIIDYLAPCNGDCSKVDKTSLEFFKIKEGGLINGASAPGRWVTDKFIEDGFTWSTTIPASLAPGKYVLRHEIIALHEGDRQNGAQFYPQCINIEVTGSGSLKPAGVKGTSLYKSSDAGVFFNVYKSNSAYPIPGPALKLSGGNGGSTAPKPTSAPKPSSTAAPRPTTLVTATTRAAPAPTKPATGGNVKGQTLYGQCGGINFQGPTTCAQGTCTKLNDYYSQCVPK